MKKKNSESYDRLVMENQGKLIHKKLECMEERPLTKSESDWFTLRLLPYDIRGRDYTYYEQCNKTLCRAAERLEKDMTAEELERVSRPCEKIVRVRIKAEIIKAPKNSNEVAIHGMENEGSKKKFNRTLAADK